MRAAALFLALALTASLPAAGQDYDALGHPQHPFDIADKAGSVLIFYCHDCPICNGYIPEINRLRADYPRFAFYLIEVDPDLTSVKAVNHIHDFNIQPPLLLDHDHRFVNLAKATVTPEAVVFGSGQTILYRGRIDDTYAALGQRRPAATTHDLRDALDSILARKPISAQLPAVGCVIPNLASHN